MFTECPAAKILESLMVTQQGKLVDCFSIVFEALSQYTFAIRHLSCLHSWTPGKLSLAKMRLSSNSSVVWRHSRGSPQEYTIAYSVSLILMSHQTGHSTGLVANSFHRKVNVLVHIDYPTYTGFRKHYTMEQKEKGVRMVEMKALIHKLLNFGQQRRVFILPWLTSLKVEEFSGLFESS